MSATESRPPVGTLYVTPEGEAWRLRGYGIDWVAKPFTGERDVPNYSIMRVAGGFSSASVPLPEGSLQVWEPSVLDLVGHRNAMKTDFYFITGAEIGFADYQQASHLFQGVVIGIFKNARRLAVITML